MNYFGTPPVIDNTSIFKSVSNAQAYLNLLLRQGGVITDEQINELDKKLKEEKLRAMGEDYRKSVKKYSIIAIVAVLGVAITIYLKRKK